MKLTSIENLSNVLGRMWQILSRLRDVSPSRPKKKKKKKKRRENQHCKDKVDVLSTTPADSLVSFELRAMAFSFPLAIKVRCKNSTTAPKLHTGSQGKGCNQEPMMINLWRTILYGGVPWVQKSEVEVPFAENPVCAWCGLDFCCACRQEICFSNWHFPRSSVSFPPTLLKTWSDHIKQWIRLLLVIW